METTIKKAAQILAADLSIAGAKKALAVLGLTFPKSWEVNPYDLGEPGTLPDGPVVLKVSQPFIAHKTEVGAVQAVSQVTAEGLRQFADSVSPKIGQNVEKVVLEEKIAIPEGGEVLLSVLHDESFGPVVVFGEGGRLTELRRQVARWLPGTSAEKIASLLQGMPLSKLWFTEYRQQPAQCDLQSWSIFLQSFGQMLAEFYRLRPDVIIRDLEINPVAFTGGAPRALDLLLTVEAVKKNDTVMARPSLERLQRSLTGAKSVAVAGVSTSDKNQLGAVIYQRLLREFAGEAWAINPKGGEIAGKKVYTNVAELPQAPDVLVVALAARFTAATLKQAYEAFGDELGTVLMLASGYDETSGGADLAKELKEVISQAGATPVVGPNTMALFAQTGSAGDVKVDFLPQGRVSIPSFTDPAHNNVALVLQSGARFASFLDRQPHIGFRWSIMVGNAYQVDVADGVALAAQDDAVKVVAVYCEGLSCGAGKRLVDAVAACRRAGKVVAIQKGGRTAQGAATARSHTASMSGSHAVFTDLLTAAGAYVVEAETEFLDLVRIASLLAEKKSRGPRVFVINGAGYEGVLSADELSRYGMTLPKPPAAVTEVLQPVLGKILDSTNNPADVGPAAPDQVYGPAVEAALESDVYDACLFTVMPHGNGMQGVLPPYEGDDSLLGPSIVRLSQKFAKPIVVSVNGGAKYDGFRNYLAEHSIPVFPDGERAARALGLWYKLTR
ncbi:MAG: acetate--CoA ligase family protein [bacterium]|nr:acetate--CoA ligase family protein [bacterium]